MKKVCYTQRVEYIETYRERRDCADQRIPEFIYSCGYLPMPLPNIPALVIDFIDSIKPEGIILTGGNSLVKYGGNAPERDATDAVLIQLAIEYKIPLYGFCRGMQSILDHFGVVLQDIDHHVAVRHEVKIKNEILKVNSFHNQGTKMINEEFSVLAVAEDGVIEAIRHQHLPIVATMWHPEREYPFFEEDKKSFINLIENNMLEY